MSAHPFSRTATHIRQTLVRYRWMLALGLLSVVAALLAYRFSSVPLVATSVVSASQVSYTDPAQQGVMDYLRAHAGVETQPLAPAQQGVMGYLRVHTVAATRPLDPAQQGVMGYLRAHVGVETQLLDPAQQGVMDYVRAHSQ